MPARPKERWKPFEAKPAISGNLVTRGSADNAGPYNYTVKRDFRRDLDIERRREGFDYFYPNLSLPVGGQPFPSQIQLDSLTAAGALVTATRLMGHWFQNGETILISGASNALYNGQHTIFNVSETTFQYTAAGAPPTPDPGPTLLACAVETINLVASFDRPNGQTCVIAGSKRRLYRYMALEDPDYISRDPADYPPGTAADQLSYWSDGTLFPADAAAYPPGTAVSQQQYVDTNPGYWIVIGWGFDPNGNRWEAVPINGYMVFNNGKNLLCTYRVEEAQVVPIYELREQGVAAVGTISELDGILMAGDISEIHSDQLATWMSANRQVNVTALTSFAGIATATVPTGHSFKVRELVTIRNANDRLYNGTFEVVAITAGSFSFRINALATTPDTSLVQAQTPTFTS